MELKSILELLSDVSEQDVETLKKEYNEVRKNKEAEFDGIPLPREHLQQLVLFDLGKNYDIQKKEIKQIILASKIEKELEEEEKNNNEVIKKDMPENTGSEWKDFVDKQERPKSSKGNYKKLKSLVKQYGIRYTLQILDPNKVPYKHDHGEYNSYKFEVKLLGIEPEYKLDEVYSKGDNKGEPMYVIGDEYALWLHDKEFWAFVDFWERVTTDGEMDTREFTYEKIDRGKYTDYIFKEV